MLSSKLHKLWRRFDKAVLQRLFGGRDARMPTYFQSVAELNQRIMRVQDHHGDVPVPSMVPRHMPMMPEHQRYTVGSSVSSTDMSTVHTADFQGSYPHSLHSQGAPITAWTVGQASVVSPGVARSTLCESSAHV